MSTHTPIPPTAPELPTTSQNYANTTAEGDAWNAAFQDDNNTANMNSITNITANAPSNEAESVNDKTTTPSPTSYSFSGSSLAKDAVNINKETSDSTTSNAAGGDANKDEDKNDDSMFECNICLDVAKDAVVSMCGHLFCWPCLHQWLETRPNRKLCPVCKAAIGKDKVIPLYGRNSAKQEDPRNKVPPRPAGQRTEPEPQQGFQGFSFGDGFHMSFGIGAFPFGYFASSLNFEPRPAPANRGTAQFEDEQQLSKLFLYLAFLCIAWLIFA